MHDSPWGGAGTDRIRGRAGDDYIYGGGEKDYLYGGPDDDAVSGDAGDEDRGYGENGCDVVDGPPARAGVVIDGCRFVRNRSLPDATYGVSGVGALRASSGAPRIRNYTFVDNESAAGVAHVRAENGDLRGNIFAGGAGAAVSNDAVPGGWAATDFNAAWNVPAPPFAGTAPVGGGNVEADPAFVDPAADDYRLRVGSPCIDAGDPADEQRDPDGSRNDIGAFGGPGGAWTPLGP